MDTLTERETEREDVPRRQDGSIDLNELARGLLEDCLNAVMSEQADELLARGTAATATASAASTRASGGSPCASRS